ncbi:MAG: hypothetical protein ACYC77_05065 [Coriobacteriia bacterium]
MNRTTLIAAIALLALALATLVAGCSGNLVLPTGVVYPSIKLDSTVTDDLTISHSFTFEGKPQVVTVIVDGALYAGAQQAEKSVIRFGSAHETDWIEAYYPAFVFEEHQDAFFADLIGQTRRIRDAEGLDADRYVELLTVFVQSLEYRTDPVDLSPKFPVETFVDLAGDCDDKTLLLGGLLAREGYAVAVMLFEAEAHVALGIRADALEYEGGDYALVETTTEGFVGMVPDSVGAGTALASEPQVFALGAGTARYSSAGQVAQILTRADELEARAAKLSDDIVAADGELQTLEAEARVLRDTLDGLSRDPARYNALLPEYNQAAEAYNAAVAARNAIVETHNAVVQAHTYIVEHLNDRVGVAEYLREHAT